jgi:tRNA nucleotidyltransferase (CCA-adding enzyme)
MKPKNIKSLLNKIGEENLRRLVPIKQADKQAQRGTRAELEAMDPAKMTREDSETLEQLRALDKYDDLITEVILSTEAFQIKDLAVNGHDMMSLGMTGRDIGDALKHLLGEVIEHPEMNTKETLMIAAERYQSYIEGQSETWQFDDRDQDGIDIAGR